VQRPRTAEPGWTSPGAPRNDPEETTVPLDAATKQRIMSEYATAPGDTGSPEVQVALLSRRISDLTDHMKQHRHDFHTQRGLLQLVGRRRRLLRYLEQKDVQRYRALIERLGLRR
jgi:small subunit ribosomal protein S15